ncbi:hypothetical protein NSP_27780 [Nodularia spumigena CCY9414]|nr:hypothetical protein NSP_27780 [Nodularia spumigena CCY9414]
MFLDCQLHNFPRSLDFILKASFQCLNSPLPTPHSPNYS